MILRNFKSQFDCVTHISSSIININIYSKFSWFKNSSKHMQVGSVELTSTMGSVWRPSPHHISPKRRNQRWSTVFVVSGPLSQEPIRGSWTEVCREWPNLSRTDSYGALGDGKHHCLVPPPSPTLSTSVGHGVVIIQDRMYELRSKPWRWLELD
jgi:hypothetical protein